MSYVFKKPCLTVFISACVWHRMKNSSTDMKYSTMTPGNKKPDFPNKTTGVNTALNEHMKTSYATLYCLPAAYMQFLYFACVWIDGRLNIKCQLYT